MRTLPITKVVSLQSSLVNTAKATHTGKTRFDRLYIIGTSSTYLYQEALRAAVAAAKQGRDVGRYDAAYNALHEIVPDDRDGIPDLGWMDRMTKATKTETDRLELELKGYRNNLIKESIRVSFYS